MRKREQINMILDLYNRSTIVPTATSQRLPFFLTLYTFLAYTIQSSNSSSKYENEITSTSKHGMHRIFQPVYSNNAILDLTLVPNPTITSLYSQAT